MSGINDARNTQRQLVTSLCQTLSEYARELRTELANSLFVAARCTGQKSRYEGLVDIYSRPQARTIFQCEITQTTTPNIMHFCYALGGLESSIKQQHDTQNGEASPDLLIQFAERVGRGSLYDLFDDTAAPDNWFAVASDLFKTLESISFNNSILARNFGRKPFTFFRCNPGLVISEQLRKDTTFQYGWICEQIVFASRAELHYCYLPPDEQDDKRWAVCLWADRPTTGALSLVQEKLQTIMRQVWTGQSRIEELAAESSKAAEVNERWRVMYHELQSELRGANPEAQQAKDRLVKLDAAYWSSLDLGARGKVVEFLDTSRSSFIAEKLPYESALDLLPEEARRAATR
jgi:hypothetical protein